MNIPPQTPADVSVFYENGKYILRVGESRSIYVYDKDTAGKPTCSGACTKEWWPVIASAKSVAVADWTLVKRADGSQQWRYRNKPIYTYAEDKPNTTLGDGIGGEWHLVTP